MKLNKTIKIIIAIILIITIILTFMFTKEPQAPGVHNFKFFGTSNEKVIFSYYQKFKTDKNICGLATYNTTTKKVIDVFPSKQGWCMETPNVSYDNKKITFGYYQQDLDNYIEQIATMSADGTDMQILTNTDTYKAWPSFSHDGKKIIFISTWSNEVQKSGRDVWEIDINSKKTTKLTNISAYRMTAPMYMSDDSSFIFSPYISSSYNYVMYDNYINKGKDAKGNTISEYYIGDKVYSVEGFWAIKEDTDEIQGLSAYQRKYGENSIFIVSNKGEQGDNKQLHDLSKPSFVFYDPAKANYNYKGALKSNPLAYKNIYYADFYGIDKNSNFLLIRGGYIDLNSYLFDIQNNKLTQLTKTPKNTIAHPTAISSDASKVIYEIFHWRGDTVDNAKLGYYLLDIHSKKHTMLDTDGIIKQIDTKLKSIDLGFLKFNKTK